MRRALPWLALAAAAGWSAAWAATPDWAAHLRVFQLSDFALAVLVTAAALAGRVPKGRGWTASLIAAAVFCRMALATHLPPLSSDIYRYVWDGRVWAAGIHPFRYAPLDPHLAFLRDSAVYPHINYPELPTIYPLVDQVFFRLGGLLAPGVIGLKFLFALVDLGLVAFLAGEIRRRALPPAWILLAALHPLTLVETSANGHADVLGALLLMAALSRIGERPVRGALGLGLTVLAKFNALAVLPALRLPRRSWGLVLGTAVLGVAVFLAPGVNPFYSLGQYLDRWRWNDSLFWCVRLATPGLVSAKAVAGALLLAWILLVSRRERDPLLAARSALGAWLVLSPVAHAWYFLWFLPFASLAPEAGWLWLMAAAPLAYGPYPHRVADSQFELSPALRLLEYGPAFALWGWAAWRGRGRAPLSSAAPPAHP